MPESATAGTLAELVKDWQPPVVATSRRVDPWPAAAFADLVDAEHPATGDGDPLPPLWHWLLLLPHPRTSEIGEDGHPAEGPFLPPIPGRRRMAAGGRLHRYGDIPFGAVLHSRSSVASVTPKAGRSGEMLFVTVRSELTVTDSTASGDSTAGGEAGEGSKGGEGSDVVAVEEQDFVYRSEPEGTPRRRTPRPDTGEPEPDAQWRLRLPTDSVLLSRFSALTYNGHRIHHDHPYTTTVEGYPDLVIHGPLMALLALELPRRHAPHDRVSAVEYRLSRPAFLPSPIVATGNRDGDQAAITVAAEGAKPSLTATVRFR